LIFLNKKSDFDGIETESDWMDDDDKF
jgi:hypothetical protein